MSLSFTPILKSSLVLIPGNTHTLELRFENCSEYDKQLFCTLRSPDGILMSRNHFDVLVPAEGICIETIKITVPENLRIFYESYFFVLETTDSVLEEDKNFAFFLKCALPWKWSIGKSTSSSVIFLGNAHACTCEAHSSDIKKELLFTSYLACAQDSQANLNINCECTYKVSLNDETLCEDRGESTFELSLKQGINQVCISLPSDSTAITAEYSQSTDYIPACINPNSL